MIANILYARALIWGLAGLHIAIVLAVCGLIYGDFVWRANTINQACNLYQNAVSTSNPVQGIEPQTSVVTMNGINNIPLVAQIMNNAHFSLNMWPFTLLSNQVNSDLGPCDALLESNQSLLFKFQAFFLVIGLSGSVLLIFIGESAIKTARYIVKDLGGRIKEQRRQKEYSLFPCLPWLYSLVSDTIKKHRNADSQRIVRISHDLKVPLQGLKSAVSEISEVNCFKNKSKLDAELQSMMRYVNHIDRSASQLRLAINDQSKLSDLPVEEIALDKILEEALLDMDVVSRKKNIKFRFSGYKGEIPIAYGNYQSVREMLLILLDNALQYSTDNSIVDVNLSVHGEQMSVSIANFGSTIPQNLLTPTGEINDIPQDSMEAVRFNGVGLSIASAIASLHKWKLLLRSVDDPKGTIAVVNIPKINITNGVLENASFIDRRRQNGLRLCV